MTRYLITSALPYINGMKHLGNFAGSLLPADVYARFLRADGEDVLFICATDDHGTPAEIGAQEAGLDVATYCHKQHERQRDVYERLGLSFDYFGRTSSPQNKETTQHIHDRLTERGFLEERSMEQIYSLDDGRFLPDRYVEGTCPHCGYEKARGDQCERCTSLLDPKDLINPRSALSGSDRLELRKTKHLFLKLDALQDEVAQWIDSHPHWPDVTKSIAHKWLSEGLRERCITRDLSWGVPVPRAGFEEKVFYVWFDAPIGYIGATREWADQDPANRSWKSWWYDAPDVEYTQFLGKDNVPFHAVFFPATILGTGEPWTLAHTIKAFHWLTYQGGKFSTSQRRGLFLDQALELLPADYWRYFLTVQSPESDDADFTWELFRHVVNKGLANTFGNFVNRTLKLTEKHFGCVIPAGGEPGPAEAKVQSESEEALKRYCAHLRALQLREAAAALRTLWSLGNHYLEATEPWKVIHEDRDRAAVILRTAINLVRTFALAASPIIPFAAERVLDSLGLTPEERAVRIRDAAQLTAMAQGRPFHSLPPLFLRIEEEQAKEWEAQFRGV